MTNLLAGPPRWVDVPGRALMSVLFLLSGFGKLAAVAPTDLAQAFGMTNPRGALVAAVQKSGPAEAAGLQPGDVITGFDDKTPTDARALRRLIAEAPLDRTTMLTVRRGDADLKVGLAIKEYPPDRMLAEFPFQLSSPPPMASDDAGLRLKPADAKTRARLKLPAETPAVEVASVPPDSAADRANLRAGDVILRVQDRPATTPQTFSGRCSRRKTLAGNNWGCW